MHTSVLASAALDKAPRQVEPEHLVSESNGEQDLDALLEDLQAQEQELSAARRKLHDRLASFPNEVTAEQERQMSKERRRELHAQIDALRARRSAARRQQGEEPNEQTHPDGGATEGT